MSLRNTSVSALMSEGTRLLARLEKYTYCPSLPAQDQMQSSLACAVADWLARSNSPEARFFRKMSVWSLVSPATRLSAAVLNSSHFPSGVSIAWPQSAFACVVPPVAVLAIRVAPVQRSFTNTSHKPLTSPATRSLDSLEKLT